MSATRDDLSSWFDRGKESNHRYMVIVCDTYDWDDYPVFCNDKEEAENRVKNPGEMQKIMEVYDLNADKEVQMNMHRAYML